MNHGAVLFLSLACAMLAPGATLGVPGQRGEYSEHRPPPSEDFLIRKAVSEYIFSLRAEATRATLREYTDNSVRKTPFPPLSASTSDFEHFFRTFSAIPGRPFVYVANMSIERRGTEVVVGFVMFWNLEDSRGNKFVFKHQEKLKLVSREGRFVATEAQALPRIVKHLRRPGMVRQLVREFME